MKKIGIYLLMAATGLQLVSLIQHMGYNRRFGNTYGETFFTLVFIILLGFFMKKKPYLIIYMVSLFILSGIKTLYNWNFYYYLDIIPFGLNALIYIIIGLALVAITPQGRKEFLLLGIVYPAFKLLLLITHILPSLPMVFDIVFLLLNLVSNLVFITYLILISREVEEDEIQYELGELDIIGKIGAILNCISAVSALFWITILMVLFTNLNRFGFRAPIHFLVLIVVTGVLTINLISFVYNLRVAKGNMAYKDEAVITGFISLSVIGSLLLVISKQEESKQPFIDVPLDEAPSGIDQLYHYKKLFDDGLITEEEYNQVKKRVLEL